MINSPLQYGISISVKELAEQTGYADLPKAVLGVWDALLHHPRPGDLDEVRRKLDVNLNAYRKLRSKIDWTSKQLDLYPVDTSAYPIHQHAARIEALYDDYQHLLDRLVPAIDEHAAGGLQGAAERQVIHGRLGALGERARVEVVESLKFIQTAFLDHFLGRIRADDKEIDFFSLFFTIKFCVARYFVAQVKGLFLLHLIDRDPVVDYRVQDQLKVFQRHFIKMDREMTTILDPVYTSVVQQLALSPQGASVSIRSDLGDSGMIFREDQRVHMCRLTQEWRLEPLEELLLKPRHEYLFRVRHVLTGNILQVVSEQHGVTGGKNLDAAWKITRNFASDLFNFEYQGDRNGRFKGYRLMVQPASKSGPAWLDAVADEWSFDPDEQFHFDDYASAFNERDYLEVDEHLAPGCHLTSDKGSFGLYYRHDGAIEVVRIRDQQVVWSADAPTAKPAMLRLQPDGNFVAYDTDNKPYWSSDKYFKDDQATYRNSILRVRKDGRVEIRLRDRDIFWITPA